MIKAKDIQRIIAANETAQEASIEIKEFVDNYVEQQLKNCNLQNVSKRSELLIAFMDYMRYEYGNGAIPQHNNVVERFLKSNL